MNNQAIAQLDNEAISEIFAPILERYEWEVVDEKTIETPCGPITYASREKMIERIQLKVLTDEREEIKLAVEREMIS